MGFYVFIKALMRLALRFYFRKIKIEGLENIPKNAPLLVTPNHQNALIDALLVGAFIPRTLHYLTRADVFNSWTKALLKKLNMMPIYRIRDGYQKLSLNEAIFSACFEVFKQNGAILIFPEGNHGKEYYLRPLTKGAARLAIQAQDGIEKDLMILPVGLNYFDHRRPQSTVLVKFGEPLSVRKYLDLYRERPAQGLITLRDAIAESLKSVMLLPEQTKDYEDRKRTIFHPKHESLNFEALSKIEPDVSPIMKPKRTPVLAQILNPLPLFLIKKWIKKTEDVVFHATIKFGIGLLAFPLWWILTFFLLYFAVGLHIAVLAVLVMVLGLFYGYQR
jgi:1-acyl-sn-glycerol-3-phosphate acyltransferase